MTLRFHVSGQFARFLLGAAGGVWLCAFGCNGENPANPSPFTSTGGSTGNATDAGGADSDGTGGKSSGTTKDTARGGAAAGGVTGKGSSSVACIPAAKSEITHSVGNYDNLSCNLSDCHQDRVGGWVYASTHGYPWIAGATVTITNKDGSKLTAVSGDDGFFDFGDTPKISSPYTVCVSKCPSTDCNVTTHLSTDCLSSGCHAKPDIRIYVTTPNAGTGGTTSTTSTSGQDCTPPASGGPYVHLPAIYSESACVSCHSDPKPTYKGGYLFDGPNSTKPVAEATITLTPADGSPVTVVTGHDGMFFFGTPGTKTTTIDIPTPYTACVSKCPIGTICSKELEHTTDDDCAKCHDTFTEGRVYLN